MIRTNTHGGVSDLCTVDFIRAAKVLKIAIKTIVGKSLTTDPQLFKELPITQSFEVLRL
jgi:hypothetical protein